MSNSREATLKFMDEIHQKSKLFYGWWIVLCALVMQFIAVGITIYTFGVFLKPLVKEFSWTRGQISLGMAIFSAVVALMGIPYGRWIDRYDPKKVVIPAALTMGITLICFRFLTPSLALFFLLYIILGIGAAGLMGVPPATMVSHWFRKRRGLALGLSMIGSSLGGIIMAPLSNYLISNFGFRNAYTFLGLLVWITVIPMAALLIKRNPEEIGLLPDGAMTVGNPKPLSLTKGMTFREARNTLSFWLLCIAIFLTATGMNGSIHHLVPFLTDKGFSPAKAAILISLATTGSLFGRVTSGYLADKLVAKYVAIGYYLIMATGLFLLLTKSGNWVYLSIVCFGLGFGAEIDLMAYLTGEYFGFSSFGEIYGHIFLFFQLGAMIGPVLMGYIFDITNSYNSALIAFITAMVLASVVISFVRYHKYTEVL